MKNQEKPFMLKSRHEEIIKAVHSYRYMTALDITRLFYAPTSIKHVREILHALSGGKDYAPNQYLFRFPLPHSHVGNSGRVFALGTRGRAYLQELGIEVDWYIRPSDVATLTYQHLQHALALTRFVIAAHLFARNNAEVELANWQSEYTLRKHTARVTIDLHTREGNEQVPMIVIPDAWLHFRFPNTPAPERPVLLEIDRGTEERKYFMRHIESRINFIKPNGEYKKMFNTDFVTVAYATTAGDTRLANMLAWTEEVLDDLGKKNYADVFRFCSLPESGEYDENTLFQASSWRRPFAKNSVSLLG